MAIITMEQTERGSQRLTVDARPFMTETRPWLAWRAPGEEAWREVAGAAITEGAATTAGAAGAAGHPTDGAPPSSADAARHFADGAHRPVPSHQAWTFPGSPLSAEIVVSRVDDSALRVSGTLRNTGSAAVHLARFHYLDGLLAGAAGYGASAGSAGHAALGSDGMARDAAGIARDTAGTAHDAAGPARPVMGLLAPTPHAEGCRLFRAGDRLPPVKRQMEELWRSMGVEWPRMADPLHTEPDWALAVDVGVFTAAWNAHGLCLGFTDPISAFGEIGMRTSPETATCRGAAGASGDAASPEDAAPPEGALRCFAGLMLDGVLLGPGESRTLDSLLIRHGDWQRAMRAWAVECARAAGAAAPPAPLVGYCSWYQYYAAVEAEHIRRASRELAAWPVPPGGRIVQIDDGFQRMPGDWRPNSRFTDSWKDLPRAIESTDSLPGLWLAPHAVFHEHPLCAEHHDWLQRLPDGRHAVSFSNWGWCASRPGDGRPQPTYWLDPDHPGARQFMYDIVRDAVSAGWRYLKIDFTYAVSTARRPHDPRRTRMESLREMYRLFREAAGPDTLICACIGEMGRYALGLAEIARLGGDIGSEWGSIRANLPDTLVRMCTNGAWWVGDPDVFHMRTERLHVSPEEAWCLTGTIGLMGGVFLTSDFPSQWSAEAAALVRAFWNAGGPLPPEEMRVAYTPEGVPMAVRVTLPGNGGRQGGAVPRRHRIGVYNWSDAAVTVTLPLEATGLACASALVRGVLPAGPARVDGGALVCADMPPHSLRIVELAEA